MSHASVKLLEVVVDDHVPPDFTLSKAFPGVHCAFPTVFVSVGLVYPCCFAYATIAINSVFVGRRQAPGAEPSDNPQRLFPRPDTHLMASYQIKVPSAGYGTAPFMVVVQFAFLSHIRPVSQSMTVPFPRFSYLSPPAQVAEQTQVPNSMNTIANTNTLAVFIITLSVLRKFNVGDSFGGFYFLPFRSASGNYSTISGMMSNSRKYFLRQNLDTTIAANTSAFGDMLAFA
jgi:hypothetical protein